MNKVRLFAGLMAAGLLFFIAGCEDDEAKVTITTADVADISTTSATAGGTVQVDGGTITERGVVFSENPEPTTSGSKAVDPTPGPGSYSMLISGLESASEYFVRSYAIVGGKTTYGNEVNFTTSGPIQLIVNGNFSTPSAGDALLATAAPWKTDETDSDIIGRDPLEYKGHTGYVWVYDWAKSFYQTVGNVPPVATEYEISFDYTCTWNAWGDYKPFTNVTFSAYSGDNVASRVEIGKVELEDPILFPGWDANTWGARTGSFTLTAEQAAAFAGKKLVIEFDVIHYDDGANFSDVWYNFDNISVKQL